MIAKDIKIRGVQITSGNIIKYIENVVYVRNFKEMTVDTNEGSWIVTDVDIKGIIADKAKQSLTKRG